MTRNETKKKFVGENGIGNLFPSIEILFYVRLLSR